MWRLIIMLFEEIHFLSNDLAQWGVRIDLEKHFRFFFLKRVQADALVWALKPFGARLEPREYQYIRS